MKDCEECKLEKCPAKCFDAHPGSGIALGKLIKASGKKVHVITE